MGSSEKDIRKYAKGAEVKRGLSINGSRAGSSGDPVKKWLSESGCK